MLTTFLRDATYTSQVNGIASIDQRLVRFSLRPGTEDPGTSQNWGVPSYIPAGKRTGLLATFNGGFKLDSAGGGFYLNGIYHGSLVKGTASVVYYKNGTLKIGEWGRDFTMNPAVAGVRQNLKLLVDHGNVAADASSDVMTNWGATLGGGYYVWRSGIGVTKDGRVVYVYGSALNAQDLGLLLQRAGAVEGMQMDINPAWMKFDYYQAKANPADPDAGDAAAHPAAQPLLLLHPVHPRLHRRLRTVTINKTTARRRAGDMLVGAAGGGQHVVADGRHPGFVGGTLGQDDDGQVLRRHVRPRGPESAFPRVAAVVEHRQPVAPAAVVEEAEAGPDVRSLRGGQLIAGHLGDRRRLQHRAASAHQHPAERDHVIDR